MARIKYGISNVHYAIATEGTGGVLTYGEVTPLVGAVSLTLDTNGDEIREYADNIVWYAQTINQGYTGTLELEELPDSFRTAVLGDTVDTNGAVWENADSESKEFALLFQFEVGGDANVTAKRGCLLRCTASRPSANMQTKEATITPNHDTLNITAMPRVSDHYVKVSAESSASAFASWFTAVPEHA